MFNDDTGRFNKRFNAFEGCIGVGDIVVGEVFALQLNRCTYTSFLGDLLRIECRLLVRIFSVSHFLALDELSIESAREIWALIFKFCTQVIGDNSIVICCVLKSFNGQVETSFLI